MVLNLTENGVILKNPTPSFWSSHPDQQEESYQDKDSSENPISCLFTNKLQKNQQ